MAAAQETVQCTIYAGKHLQTDATSTFGTLKCDAYIKVLTCVIDRSKWRDSESAGTTLVKNSSSPHAWKQQTPRSVVLSKCAIPKGGIIKVRLECWNKTDDYSGKARVKHLLGCADITFDKDSVAGDFLYGWVQLDQAQVPHAAIQVAVGLAPYTVTTTQLDAQKYVGGSKVKKPLTKVKVRRKPEVPRKVTKKKKKKHLTVGTGKVVPAVNTKTPRVGWGVTDKSVVFKPHNGRAVEPGKGIQRTAAGADGGDVLQSGAPRGSFLRFALLRLPTLVLFSRALSRERKRRSPRSLARARALFHTLARCPAPMNAAFTRSHAPLQPRLAPTYAAPAC